MVSLTKDVIEIIKRESQVVDFWGNYTKQRALKSNIIKNILLPKLGSNEILFTKRNEIAQKLMELAYHIYRK